MLSPWPPWFNMRVDDVARLGPGMHRSHIFLTGS